MTIVEKRMLPRLRRFIRIYRRPVYVTLVAFAGVGAVALTGHLYVKAHTTEYYQVLLRGQPIGGVSSPGKVESWLAAKAQQLAAADTPVRKVLDEAQVAIRIERAYKAKTDEARTLALLEQRIRTHPVGVQLIVGDRVVGLLRDQETADALLARIKNHYAAPASSDAIPAAADDQSPDTSAGGSRLTLAAAPRTQTLAFSAAFEPAQMREAAAPRRLVTSVGFMEPVRTAEVRIAEHSLSDPEELYRELVMEDESGDTVLHVTSEEQVTELEAIDPPVEYRKSEDLRAGKTVVIRQGQEGLRRVTYRLVKTNGSVVEEVIVSEQVVRKPVSTILLKGSKVIAGEGSGKFAWPVLGHRITSYMGKRWGRMHKGIDIIGRSGIQAADNGVIEFAGYKSGGLGNTIIIDHRNGFKTVYGHLKSIKVRENQVVQKGDTIGIMGSTGHSTGTHLHFEVYRNGKLKNPVDYL